LNQKSCAGFVQAQLLPKHVAIAAIKPARGLDSPALVTPAMMNEITARRKLRSILI
jgi:hypothetical protein